MGLFEDKKVVQSDPKPEKDNESNAAAKMRYRVRRKSSNPVIATEIQAVADNKNNLRSNEIPKDLIEAIEQNREEEKEGLRRDSGQDAQYVADNDIGG